MSLSVTPIFFKMDGTSQLDMQILLSKCYLILTHNEKIHSMWSQMRISLINSMAQLRYFIKHKYMWRSRKNNYPLQNKWILLIENVFTDSSKNH